MHPANATACKRCGGNVVPHNRGYKKFCSVSCRQKWHEECRPTRVVERMQQSGKTFGDRARARYGAPPVIELTDTQAAWLAGFVDGEGTVGIARYQTSGGRTSYRCILTFSNTNKDAISFVRSLLGDNVTYTLPKPQKPHHKPCYKVTVRLRAIVPLLHCLLPFLIVKQRQARFVLSFYKALDCTPITQPNHEIFERLYMECKALNKRGVQ